MSPYSMGILAHYSSSVANLTSLMTGGMPDFSQTFSPPEHLISAFKESYKLVRAHGSFLSWDSEGGAFVETPLSNMSAKPRKLYDAGLNEWERWFVAHEKFFESIHRVLTAAGVGDVIVVRVPLEDMIDAEPSFSIPIVDAMIEKERLGLAL